jgi:hypothetical protein
MITATYRIAYAAGTDAGNRSMRRNGRTTWNEQDRAAAYDTFAAIFATTY